MSAEVRLTCARRLCIARALEASEHPERVTGRAEVAAALKDVKAAMTAVGGIDPTGQCTARLRAELDRRLVALVDRFDTLWSDDRRHVVAQILALAALGRAAGHPIQPRKPALTPPGRCAADPQERGCA